MGNAVNAEVKAKEIQRSVKQGIFKTWAAELFKSGMLPEKRYVAITKKIDTLK